MKKIKAALLFALLATNINAKDSVKDSVYVGLEFGFARYYADITKSNYSEDLGYQEGYSTYQVLHLGKYFGAHRISFEYDASREIGLDYDYFFNPFSFANNLLPYIGTGIYYQTAKYINSNASEKGTNITLMRLGLEYQFDDKFSLDMGLSLNASTRTFDSSYLSYDNLGSRNYFLSILYKL